MTRLRDVENVEAYVAAVARSITGNATELEELTADGLELALQKETELAPGESLSRALATWLAWRMRDRARKRRREGRAEPVGDRDEVSMLGEDAFVDVEEIAESRMALDHLKGELDLSDPRIIGRLMGVPSWRPPATGARGDLWQAIQDERTFIG